MTGTLQALLEQWERERALDQPACLRARIELLDELEEAIGISADADPALLQRALAASAQLEALNRGIYAQIRADIRHGRGASSLLEHAPPPLFGGTPEHGPDGEQYDYLDALLSGVLPWPQPDEPSGELMAEMVFYQPTPARHIFDLVQRVPLSARDVLIDLGAGLGHVPLLVAICTQARSIGVEWEAAYVACAQQCAQGLRLERVRFLQQDARYADLAQGTVFYLYTPFSGAMLRCVLDRLAQEAAARSIRVCTLGPCTEVVARERWLRPAGPLRADRIAVFCSTRT